MQHTHDFTTPRERMLFYIVISILTVAVVFYHAGVYAERANQEEKRRHLIDAATGDGIID